VELIRRRADVDADVLSNDIRAPSTDGAGSIIAVYTIGAPRTARPPLRNNLDIKGCFGGIRMYTQHTGSLVRRVDSVPIVLRVGLFEHALYESLPVSPVNEPMGELKIAILPCSAENSRKPSSIFGDMSLHPSSVYANYLLDQSALAAGSYDELLRLTRLMQLSNYSTTDYVSNAQRLQARLIARVMLKENRSWMGIDLIRPVSDNAQFGWNSVALLQEADTLNCYISWLGVDTWNDYAEMFVPKWRDFCGFSGVHAGISLMLEGMTATEEFRLQITPKLSYCSNVASIGHGFGGALAEIYAACVNHLAAGLSDARVNHMKFVKGTPMLQPEVDSNAVPDIDGLVELDSTVN